MNRIEHTVQIKNRLGLHARPAMKIVETTQRYRSVITLSHNGKSANANTVMGLLLLEAAQGQAITIAAEGPDAEQALQAVTDLIEARFDEE